ncbi:MAG: phosphatase PAP2 family protein [Bacteroidota bacterium]
MKDAILANQSVEPSPPPSAGFLRHNWVFLGGFVLFLLGGSYFLLTTPQGALEFTLNRYRSPANDRLWYLLTQLAEEKIYILGLLLLAAISYRKAAAFALLGIMVPISSGLLKGLFAAPRPMRWFYDYEPELWAALFRFPETASSWAFSSFPSGHATSAFAVYGFLAFTAPSKLKPWVGLVCILCAISVAISRQYLLFHFLKDVLAGACLGVGLAAVFHLLQSRLWPKSKALDRGFLPPRQLV